MPLGQNRQSTSYNCVKYTIHITKSKGGSLISLLASVPAGSDFFDGAECRMNSTFIAVMVKQRMHWSVVFGIYETTKRFQKFALKLRSNKR